MTRKAQEGFEEFCRRNPWFMGKVRDEANIMRNKGLTRGSMKMIFELLRLEINRSAQPAPLRLDNSWTPYAARKLIQDYPEFDRFFEIRIGKG